MPALLLALYNDVIAIMTSCRRRCIESSCAKTDGQTENVIT